MNVIEQDSGWAVTDDDGSVIKDGFASNSAAWRWRAGVAATQQNWLTLRQF
jgi:hypothetical protein